jgi:hypothetical protein
MLWRRSGSLWTISFLYCIYRFTSTLMELPNGRCKITPYTNLQAILVDSNSFRSFVRPAVLDHCSDPVVRRNWKIEARYIVTVFSLVTSVQLTPCLTKIYVPSITYVGLSKFDFKKYTSTVDKLSLRTNLFMLFFPMFERLNLSRSKFRMAATFVSAFLQHPLSLLNLLPTISQVYVTITFLRRHEDLSKHTLTLKALDDVNMNTTR